MKSVLPALLLILATCAHGADEALGRLFFTPEERARLDRLAAPSPATAAQRLDGVLTRSDGQQILFVGGKALRPAERTRDPAAASLFGADGRLHPVRVGEHLGPP